MTVMDETTTFTDVTSLPGDDDDDDSPGYYVYIFCVNIIIGTIGVLGNSLVVVVVLRSRRLRKRLTNLFIVNQSAVDAVSSALLIATYATDLARLYGQVGTVSNMTCKWWVNQASLWAGFTASTYSLLALNFERYLGVVHPILHKRAFTQNKALVVMVSVWVFGLTYGWAYAVPSSGMVGGFCEILSLWPSVFWQEFFGITNLVIQFLLPLAVMAYYYIHMIAVLRGKTRVAPMHTAAAGNAHSAKSSKAQRKILKMLLLISFCFVLCWSWNEILVALMSFGYSVELAGPFFEFTVIMVFLNCCCNPFIYAFKHEGIRTELLRLLPKSRRVSPETSTMQVSTIDTPQGTLTRYSGGN